MNINMAHSFQFDFAKINIRWYTWCCYSGTGHDDLFPMYMRKYTLRSASTVINYQCALSRASAWTRNRICERSDSTIVKHSRSVGSFRVVRAYDACTLPRYIKMKIRGSKTMSLFRLRSLIFQKKKKCQTLKKKERLWKDRCSNWWRNLSRQRKINFYIKIS